MGKGEEENDVEVKRLLVTTAVRATDVELMLGVVGVELMLDVIGVELMLDATDVAVNKGGGGARSMGEIGGVT